MQSVCKLPKPSSLRFYTQPTAEELKQRKKLRRQGLPTEPDPEVAQLNFALSVDGVHLMRYNVTMHVMSIYSWEDVRNRLNQSAYHNVSFIREPLPPPPDPRVAAALRDKMRERISGSSCVWIIAESLDLQDYQTERGLTVGFTTIPEGEEDPDPVRRKHCAFVDKFSEQLQEVFVRTVASFGGRPVPYLPPKFVFNAPPEEEYGEDEIAQMEKEYYDAMPRRPGVWAGSIVAPLEAVRCCIKIIRELLRAPWDASILEDTKYAPVKLPYQPKDAVEKQFPSSPDPEAAVWLNRGPRLRLYVAFGDTNTPPHELRDRINGLVTRDVDGAIVIDPAVQRILKPLTSFFSSQPVPAAQVGSATVVVPPELAEWMAHLGTRGHSSPHTATRDVELLTCK